MSGPWEKYSGAGDDAAPVLASKDRRMQKTISDIEAGVPAAPLHWKGEPLETSAPAAGPWMKYAGEKPRGLSGDNAREEPGTGLDDWGPGGENKPGFWEEFSKNIIPTQKDFAEGMLGRTVSGLAERAKTAIFGEKTLAQIAAEGKPIRYKQAQSPSKMSVGESFVELGKAAIENPGKTTAELLKSMVVDPEVFMLPNLGLPAKASQIAARGGRVVAKAGQMAGAGAELGLKGAALETAAQLAPEEQPADWQAPLHAGAMWAIPGAALGGFGKSAYKGKAKPGEAPGEAPREPDAPEMGTPEGPGPFDPNAPGSKIWEQRTKEQRAETLANSLMQRGASIKEVEAIIKRNPLVGEKLEAIRQRRADAAAAFDRDFGVRQGEVLPPEGGGMEPARAGRTFEEPKEPTPAAIARSQGGAADPRLLAGLAAAGLTYAAFQDMLPVEQNQVLAGLGLAGTVAIAPKSSLGALRDQGRYSTKVLNRLPDGRTDFKKTQIEQELRRPDVGKEEKELLTRILRDTPGDTISANDLMARFRLETGDHTLAIKQTPQYADYGLEAIDRFSYGRRENGYIVGSHEDSTLSNVATNLYRLPEGMELPEVTRTNKEGAVISSRRHFDDPRYFAHTRTFTEDGVTHVVELQSDLMSAMGAKADVAGAKAALTELAPRIEAAEAEVRRLEKKLVLRSAWAEGDTRPLIQRELDEAYYRLDELQTKYLNAESAIDLASKEQKLSPITKNWERRIIREELKRAADKQRAKESEADQWARELTALPEDTPGWEAAVDAYSKAASEAELGKVIRFADADTVAKVEGWPEAQFKSDVERLEHLRRTGADPGMVEILEERLAAGEGKTYGKFKDPGHQSIYDRYKRDITKYLKSLGGKEVTDQHGHGWIEVPLEKFKGPVEMYGKADPRLLAGLAAAGITAAAFMELSDEAKERILEGLAIGGVAGITWGKGKGGVAEALRSVKDRVPVQEVVKEARRGVLGGLADFAGRTVGIASTSITHPALKLQARNLEMGIMSGIGKRLVAADPFVRSLRKLPEELQTQIASALYSGNAAKLSAALKASGNGMLEKEYAAATKVLKDLGTQLKNAGLIANVRENYFPRIVKDRKGLLESLGLQMRDALEKALYDAERAATNARGYGLTELESSAIINKFLKGYRAPGTGMGGYRKGRVFEEVTAEMLPYYATPLESLHAYLTKATQDLELAKFFGKDVVKKQVGDAKVIDVDASIGAKVDKLLRTKEITTQEAIKLGDVLRERWIHGEAPMNKAFQFLRDFGYMAYLAQIPAAIRQLGDVALPATMYGWRPTLRSVYRVITGKAEIPLSDLGVTHVVAEELSSPRKMQRLMNASMKLSGFELADRFGKQVAVDTAMRYWSRKVKSEKGLGELAEKYQQAFGPEFPELVKDLQAGRRTERVNSLIFSELSDIQPVSRLEMPRAYLAHPNGRLLFQMKSWMLKQFDVIRRNVYEEIAKGNTKKGMAYFLRYSVFMGMAGATMENIADWILGRNPDFADPNFTEAFLKNFGMSEYLLSKMEGKRPVAETVASVTVPPSVGVIDQMINADPKIVKSFPAIGQLLYSHEMGGKEEFAKREKQKERREGPAAKRLRERQEARRKAKEREKWRGPVQ